MERLRGVPRSLVAWLSAGLGIVWKGSEVAHHAEYLRSIVFEHFDVQAILGFMFGHPSLALVAGGVAWIVYSKRARKPSKHDLSSTDGPGAPPQSSTCSCAGARVPPCSVFGCEEVVLRERITEREVVYRKEHNAS